jgi:hypothetical protein
MTQDVYLGRRSVDSQAADALEAALTDALTESDNRGKTVGKQQGQDRVDGPDLLVRTPAGT